MNFLEKIKNGEQKKLIENSVIFLMLFIIIIIVMNTLFTSEENTVSSTTNMLPIKEEGMNDNLDEMLEEILSLIEGTGKVDVMIAYFNGIEQVPMYDEKISTTITEESDTAGGKRKTNQTNNEHNVIFEEKNNMKMAVIKQTIMPEIIGVIVVAEGANDIRVKENIIKAVEATVNVPSHKIQVFTRKNN